MPTPPRACYIDATLSPPRPRLFKAIAVLGMLIGGLGAVNAVTGVSVLSRGEAISLNQLGLEYRTDQEALIARRMQEAAERVYERNRKISGALTIANALLSSLLFVASTSITWRRPWAHALMVQAAIGCALYELPATAHQLRLTFQMMRAQERFLPSYLAALAEPSPPDAVAFASSMFLLVMLAYILGMATLRLCTTACPSATCGAATCGAGSARRIPRSEGQRAQTCAVPCPLQSWSCRQPQCPPTQMPVPLQSESRVHPGRQKRAPSSASPSHAPMPAASQVEESRHTVTQVLRPPYGWHS
jgi:hypothetical protein